MCTVSMIGDHYSDKWRWVEPRLVPYPVPQPFVISPQPQVSREEFDQLRREVGEMVELMKRAKKYDEEHGEPDCEMQEKVALLRKVAELVGVDLGSLLPAAGEV